jgi:hypothetical protein
LEKERQHAMEMEKKENQKIKKTEEGKQILMIPMGTHSLILIKKATKN